MCRAALALKVLRQMPFEFGHYLHAIDSDCPQNHKQFHHIQSPLTEFVLPNKRGWLADALRQLSL